VSKLFDFANVAVNLMHVVYCAVGACGINTRQALLTRMHLSEVNMMQLALCFLRLECLQVRSQNLVNELKAEVNQVATAALESAGLPSSEAALLVSKLAHHIFRRCVNTLLSSSAICGTGKVDAFKELLLREKFWTAAFGVAAHLALTFGLQVPGASLCPCIASSVGMFQSLTYEMWHLARCAASGSRQHLAAHRMTSRSSDAHAPQSKLPAGHM
jgi:hypothetical protein